MGLLPLCAHEPVVGLRKDEIQSMISLIKVGGLRSLQSFGIVGWKWEGYLAYYVAQSVAWWGNG